MYWSKELFLLFLSIRTLMALLSISWYVPDETWQSVEVAHGLVWPGKGFRTWEWEHGLRSFLHPLAFVPAFQESILHSSMSVENFSDVFSSSHVGQISTQKWQI
jgi:hypothetical protein